MKRDIGQAVKTSPTSCSSSPAGHLVGLTKIPFAQMLGPLERGMVAAAVLPKGS